MKPKPVLKIDLTKIDGEGDFPCPSCGANISPDDVSETTYEIREVKAKGDSLEELVIICKKCRNVIHIVGFEALNEEYQ